MNKTYRPIMVVNYTSERKSEATRFESIQRITRVQSVHEKFFRSIYGRCLANRSGLYYGITRGSDFDQCFLTES
jgi:hypothetical protein